MQNILKRRGIRQILQVIIDFSLSVVAVSAAVFLTGLSFDVGTISFVFLFSTLRVQMNYFFGSYRQIWRYTSLRELKNLGFTALLSAMVAAPFSYLSFISPSLSTLFLDAGLYFTLASALRVIRRLSLTLKKITLSDDLGLKRVLFVGAGNTANILIQDIKNNHANIEIVGILDDSPEKQDAEIHDVKVFGKTAQLEHFIHKHNIQSLIITMPSAEAPVINDLVTRARRKGLSVKVTPNIHSLANIFNNNYRFSFRLEDLLDIKEIPSSIKEELDKDRQKRVLVTGGFGYIGTHLVKILLDNGFYVRVLENYSYGKRGAEVIGDHPNLDVVYGDIANIKDVVRCVKNVDTVIALAAIVGDPACSLDAEETLNLNFESTKILVETANFYGVSRFVFASSCSVYGASEDTFLDEDACLNPVSLYARTRIMSEEVVLERCGNMKPVIFRLSTVFGLSPRMRFDLVVNTLTVRGIVDKKFQVFGGDQWRPFIHCHDVARAFYLATTATDKQIEPVIFNLGGNGMNYTLGEIGSMIHTLLPDAEYDMTDNIDDPRNYKVKFDRIKKHLNFEPEYTIQSGVEEMILAIKGDGDLQNYSKMEYSNLMSLKEKSTLR
jgi:nucleoside-diphosphate-sugar epimerase